MFLRVVSLLKFEDQLSVHSNLLIIEQTLPDQQLKMIKRTDSMLFLALQKPKGLLSQRQLLTRHLTLMILESLKNL